MIANESNDGHLPHYKPLLDSTCGTLLIGTPQWGSDSAAFITSLLGLLEAFWPNVNKLYHQNLEQGSAWLQEQCEQYASISGRFSTKCFYETQEMQVAMTRRLVCFQAPCILDWSNKERLYPSLLQFYQDQSILKQLRLIPTIVIWLNSQIILRKGSD